VTDVEKLVRDPYSIYAKRVLGLRPLEAIDADPGLPERGQIIHDVLEEFVRLPPSGRDPVAALRELGRQHFARHAQAPEVMALWWPRFEAVAIWFCAQHRQRQEEIARLGTELEGSLSVDAGSGSYRIRTRADRVEVRRDGSLAILDYKTGALPSGAEVRSGLRPQLVLEALIAAGGGFPGIPAIVPAELLYWGLKGSEDAPGEVRDPLGKASVGELIIRAREWLHRLMAHFADPSTAYIPVPRPEIAPVQSDYEHLARTAEWRDAGGEA
jgi:ATP-dependent helicase/nuclease subunit B